MTDHSSAIVPIESWCYCSPEVRACGKRVDIGLFAEALIYYDRVYLNIGNQPQLAEFIKWFILQDRFEDFLSLVMDGTITIYEYSFMTTAIHDKRTGSYSIWNLQDDAQKEPNTFEKRFLYHKSIQELFPKARYRKRLYDTLRGNVIEVKADEMGNTIENARKDYQNPGRNTLILQAFIDELYDFRKLGHPPEIIANVTETSGGSKHRITWNIDFSDISRLAGKELNFHLGSPLIAGALSNRLLWSSAQLGCDLFLPQPMSVLVGDKLYESTERVAKAGAVIEELKAKVEFPNVRVLVNDGQLDLKEILKIRAKARKFRDWLQSESERDRDAIIAYHNVTIQRIFRKK